MKWKKTEPWGKLCLGSTGMCECRLNSCPTHVSSKKWVWKWVKVLEQRICANALYLLQFCCEPKAHLKTCRHKYDNNNKRQNVKQYIFGFLYSLMCLFVLEEKRWRKGVGTKWFVNYIHNILLTNNCAYLI